MPEKQIGFRFVGIHIISKSMAEMPGYFTPQIVFNFNVKVETKVQAPNKLVMSFVNVIITEVEKPLELSNITVACLFEIEDFENVIVLSDDKLYTVPVQLETIIRPVSISTTRGIIYSELRGTYLNNAIMPVVYMDAFKELDQPNK